MVQPEAPSGQHLLLVDDMVTTSTPLEACGRALTQGGNVRLSFATLCTSSR